jgi:hypothetical protein
MAVKRKLSAAISNEPKRRAPKAGPGSGKSSVNTQKPSKKPIILETDSFSEEEEFKGFGDDSDQMDDDKSDLEEESTEEFEEDELDDEDEEMEEDGFVKVSKPSKPAIGSSSSGTGSGYA